MIKTITAIFTLASIFLTSANISTTSSYTAKAYVLIEAATGRVIMGENEHVPLPNASTTKIMTALITLEQENLTDEFVVDSTAIKVEGTSMGLRQGDRVSLHSLAVGMLLSSGNDAANAAAVRIAGSQEKFVTLMNKRAKELSMLNTNFKTPSGLHNDEHYSTAYDMAILARVALKNASFAQICGSEKTSVVFGNPPVKRTFTNHNKLLSMYNGCVGVKTGFTKKAGRCLVSAATKDGVTLIGVTLGASDDWNIHKALFDKGFGSVKLVQLPMPTKPLVASLVGGKTATMKAVLSHPPTAPINPNDIDKIEQIILLDRFYYAPIKAGDIVGEIKYFLDGNEVSTAMLVAS